MAAGGDNIQGEALHMVLILPVSSKASRNPRRFLAEKTPLRYKHLLTAQQKNKLVQIQ